MRYLLFFILIGSASASLLSAETQPISSDGKAQQSAPVSTNTGDISDAQKQNQEVSLAKAQLAAAKEFNGAILSTVYWALGGTFVLAGLLVGFGWFANFKVYERDKLAMKAELEALLAARLSEMESKTSENLRSLVASETKELVAHTYQKISSSLNSVSFRLFELDRDQLKNRMKSNTSASMALTDAMFLFRMCINKSPGDVPEIIQFMLEKIDKGGKLTAKEITDLNGLLDSLPSHYRTLTEKLRAKLVASDIFNL